MTVQFSIMRTISILFVATSQLGADHLTQTRRTFNDMNPQAGGRLRSSNSFVTFVCLFEEICSVCRSVLYERKSLLSSKYEICVAKHVTVHVSDERASDERKWRVMKELRT